MKIESPERINVIYIFFFFSSSSFKISFHGTFSIKSEVKSIPPHASLRNASKYVKRVWEITDDPESCVEQQTKQTHLELNSSQQHHQCIRAQA